MRRQVTDDELDDLLAFDSAQDFESNDDAEIVVDEDGIPIIAPAVKKKPPLPPVDVGEPLQVEADSVEEVSDLLKGFRARAKRENDRMAQANDYEHWVCLCFATTAQREEFLVKLMPNVAEEVRDAKHLNGMWVAEELGITLESPVPEIQKVRAFDREYIDMAMDL